jgi:hypothetical protein
VPLRWQLRDLLPDLARTFGVQFISDAYWRMPPGLSVTALSAEPVALFELLDRATGRWPK